MPFDADDRVGSEDTGQRPEAAVGDARQEVVLDSNLAAGGEEVECGLVTGSAASEVRHVARLEVTRDPDEIPRRGPDGAARGPEAAARRLDRVARRIPWLAVAPHGDPWQVFRSV
jgi:hypothetical protein